MDLASEFNKVMQELIVMLEKKSRTEQDRALLNTLKRRIFLVKSTMSDAIIMQEAAPFFISYSSKILEPDMAIRDQFFLTLNVKEEYLKKKVEIKKEDEFIFTLTDSIKNHYIRSQPEERVIVYNHVKSMLVICTKYMITIAQK